MIKLLIGGSPCTHWSIAQTKDRETTASGLGWELFKNYLYAKERFKPDFFLYENNKSAAQAIKDQISEELGVELMYINSALVSAQNRQRFYAFNWHVQQPADRGILLKDILEGNGTRIPPYGASDKSRPVIAGYEKQGASANQVIKNAFPSEHCKQLHDYVAVPVDETTYTLAADSIAPPKSHAPHDCIRIGTIENSAKNKAHDSKQYRVYSPNGKSTTLCGQGGGLGAKTGLYAVPIKLADIGNGGQGNRLYSVEGKAVTQTAGSGGIGSNTGLYAIPVNTTTDGKAQCLRATCYKDGMQNMICNSVDRRTCVAIPSEYVQNAPIYEVRNSLIFIKENAYPIELDDGYYAIRKLTVTECSRLQTLPDDYCKAVSKSQAYKGLGNGWTAEVIIHILSGALANVDRNEKIVVLSMYDGIGTGRYCLDKMGFKNVEYYAFEIDEYAMKVANDNYPDIMQYGDAFQMRDNTFNINGLLSEVII